MTCSLEMFAMWSRGLLTEEGYRIKKSRFSEEQIMGILREQEVGQKAAEICRRHGVSEATFWAWKSK
ncbi:hypothetical protein C0V82_01225 [Niveispirillum cyanobacteriorum]|uniref:Uncharacterized protein n=1 Tax=Niveispirillum cyanobacteriorum TaxID=1612173 RepID=A0A2K9N7A3_9PROT|nr:hypothetical protein C0V82_01225 [Niveispirillum cyanobacteriorum]GGE68263.1 hypothetical protein GCM10011317_26900 [Niveispirillum cyanobacteriorum]